MRGGRLLDDDVTQSLFKIYDQFSATHFWGGAFTAGQGPQLPPEKSGTGPRGTHGVRAPLALPSWCPFLCEFFSNKKNKNIFAKKKSGEKKARIFYYYLLFIITTVSSDEYQKLFTKKLRGIFFPPVTFPSIFLVAFLAVSLHGERNNAVKLFWKKT
jgi:hypothetical protein